jgi:hypothetical protein
MRAFWGFSIYMGSKFDGALGQFAQLLDEVRNFRNLPDLPLEESNEGILGFLNLYGKQI